nr:ANTAR domain-containing protein [Mycolicibacterium palauense]
MRAEGVPPLDGRRALDLAEGILIGLRRCSVQQAFDELVTVARRHKVTVLAVASALVELATDAPAVPGHGLEVRAAVQVEWGQLLRSGGVPRLAAG